MPTSDYFKSAYPDGWQILGISVLPFSLGHYFKLKRLGCAFVSDDSQQARLGDLLTGIMVCSMPSDPDISKDQFWTWFNAKEGGLRWKFYRAVARLWGKQAMTPAERDIFKWGQRIGKFDFPAKVAMFASYVKENTEPPGFWEKDTAGETQGGHWSHGILHALTAKCGYSLHEAYNAPMGKAIADFYKYAESEGAGRLMTPEEMEATKDL